MFYYFCYLGKQHVYVVKQIQKMKTTHMCNMQNMIELNVSGSAIMIWLLIEKEIVPTEHSQ
jgi:hypothetical protein